MAAAQRASSTTSSSLEACLTAWRARRLRAAALSNVLMRRRTSFHDCTRLALEYASSEHGVAVDGQRAAAPDRRPARRERNRHVEVRSVPRAKIRYALVAKQPSGRGVVAHENGGHDEPQQRRVDCELELDVAVAGNLGAAHAPNPHVDGAEPARDEERPDQGVTRHQAVPVPLDEPVESAVGDQRRAGRKRRRTLPRPARRAIPHYERVPDPLESLAVSGVRIDELEVRRDSAGAEVHSFRGKHLSPGTAVRHPILDDTPALPALFVQLPVQRLTRGPPAGDAGARMHPVFNAARGGRRGGRQQGKRKHKAWRDHVESLPARREPSQNRDVLPRDSRAARTT